MDKKGFSQLIATAALIPIILMIMAGTINIAIISNMQTLVNEAAFEGARIGVKSDTPAQTAVQAAVNFGQGITGWELGDRLIVNAAVNNNMLSVEVSYTFNIIGGQQRTVVGKSSLRISDTP